MKTVIFYDLDGTLADTRRDIVNAANDMIRRMGKEPLAAAEIESYVGRGLHELVGDCLKTDDRKTIQRGAKFYREYYAGHLLDHTRLYPGAGEVLEYFKNRRQAVVTNKPEPFTTQILEKLGIRNYFSDVVSGDSPYPRKPDPAALEAILRAASAKPQQALFVGDSPVDIETARRAGIEIAAVPHGFSPEHHLEGADVIVPSFEVLLEHAKKSNW
jgi:phosphoglycolate phosphatase